MQKYEDTRMNRPIWEDKRQAVFKMVSFCKPKQNSCWDSFFISSSLSNLGWHKTPGKRVRFLFYLFFILLEGTDLGDKEHVPCHYKPHPVKYHLIQISACICAYSPMFLFSLSVSKSIPTFSLSWILKLIQKVSSQLMPWKPQYQHWNQVWDYAFVPIILHKFVK